VTSLIIGYRLVTTLRYRLSLFSEPARAAYQKRFFEFLLSRLRKKIPFARLIHAMSRFFCFVERNAAQRRSTNEARTATQPKLFFSACVI
jgi:hypothetical protein